MEKFKEILVCVIGGIPQIITETLYALSQSTPPVNIEEMYIITTSTGKKQIENALIEKGILKQFLTEYDLPQIEIKPSSIIVIKDKDGNEIDDIRDSSQSEATADTIISLIRELTTDNSVRLHCCLAGGRKTMSFYLGSALQLFGRSWDKLYHVLVSPEFESHPEFFYKPKKARFIKCRLANGTVQEISTEKAKIEIMELPFIKFSGKIQLHGKNFKELIQETQSEIDLVLTQPEIILYIKDRKIEIAGVSFTMSPILITLYATFLQQKILCPKDALCGSCTDCYVSLGQITEEPFAKEFAKFYSKTYNPVNIAEEEIIEYVKKKLNLYTLRTYISKINREISKALNDEATPCKIKSVRKYGATIYGIAVDKTKIKIN
ncbi:MAG: CRISPR-associated ring nuclease Csm6 [Thermodesulfovibrio sp.]